MTDRPGSQPPPEQDDSDLDYLDAAVSESLDEDRPRAEPPADQPAPARVTPVEPVRVAEPEPRPETRTVAVEKVVERDRTWSWPVINLVSLLAVIGVFALADLLPINDLTTPEVADANEAPFQPAGWFYTLLGVAIVLLVLYTLYGLLPGGRRNERVQRTSQFFLLANVAIVAWVLFWHWEQFAASMVCLLVLLVALLFVYFGLRIRNPLRRSDPNTEPGLMRKLVVWLPFSIYLAVATILALTNLMMWFRDAGWDGGPLSYTWWAVVFMAGVALVAALFTFLFRDLAVPVVLGIGLVAVAQHIWDDAVPASLAAVVFAVVCFGLAAVAWILEYDRTNNRSPFGRSGSSGTPPPMSPVE